MKKQTKKEKNEKIWSDSEIQDLINANLVPKELLHSSQAVELLKYIQENKDAISTYMSQKEAKENYLLNVPSPSEWHKAPDITVLDKKTGEISTLEMAGLFNLCEGVNLHIKAKELPEWEKETADAKKLNKEQHETLKSTLEKIGTDKPLTRKEIVAIIKEIRKPQRKTREKKLKNQTFRQSRELIDNKLDRKIDDQLTFFDIYDLGKLKNIDEIPSDKLIIKGLDLDQGEDRLIHTLTLLLSKKSENQNQNSKEYYLGNYEKGIVSINQTEMETARIILQPHELYSTYYGRENYNSDHIKFILNKLDCLSKKNFLTTWNFPAPDDKDKYNKFRTYLPLFTLGILNLDLSEKECQDIDNNKDLLEGKGCQFLFKFQPQFTNDIRHRYVEFPEDIHLRISEAAGKDRYGQCVNLMRDFLFREKQLKRYEIVRDKTTFINTLKLDKFSKAGRKKKVNEMIEECVQIFLKIGLLKEWEEVTGKQGQSQYKIHINRDFK